MDSNGSTGQLCKAEAYQGSTSKFLNICDGVILKFPARREASSRIANNFLVERRILEHLGPHPRLVQYLGWQERPEASPGLLLARASHGSLQQQLDERGGDIPLSLRLKWCHQAIEAIAFIHARGVLHSDLRPDNFLVHSTQPGLLDLQLCDFGGSFCNQLRLDGGQLPSSGFYDPNLEPESTEDADIFSIASVLYSILTGHWPYRDSGGHFTSGEEMNQYQQKVDNNFMQKIFPDVTKLLGGEIILGCWRHEYEHASDVLQDWEAMENQTVAHFDFR